MKGRKGLAAHDMIMFIPKFVFLIIVMICVIFLIKIFIVNNIDVRYAESMLLVERVTNSPTGIIYFDDELMRPYPGVIDLKKFSNENIRKVIELGSDYKDMVTAAFILTFDDDPPNASEVGFIIDKEYEYHSQANAEGDPSPAQEPKGCNPKVNDYCIAFYNRERFIHFNELAKTGAKGPAGVQAYLDQRRLPIYLEGERYSAILSSVVISPN